METTKKSVWLLFSCCHSNYDQPDQAFESIWFKRPTIEQIQAAVGKWSYGVEITESIYFDMFIEPQQLCTNPNMYYEIVCFEEP